MYSFISDIFGEPSIRVVYTHYGLRVGIVNVYAYDSTKGGYCTDPKNPDILAYISKEMRDALIKEIQEYLVTECGVEE